MLPGSFVERSRKCGKPNCRCAGGEKLHSEFLLFVRVDGKPKTFHVPAALAGEVRSKVELRKRLEEAAARIAGLNLRRFLGRKEKSPACAATNWKPSRRGRSAGLRNCYHRLPSQAAPRPSKRFDSSRGFAPPTSSLCCPQPDRGDSAPASRRPGPPVLVAPEEPLQISFRSALEAESPVSMRLSPHTGPPCEIAAARQRTRQRTLAGSPPGLR